VWVGVLQFVQKFPSVIFSQCATSLDQHLSCGLAANLPHLTLQDGLKFGSQLPMPINRWQSRER